MRALIRIKQLIRRKKDDPVVLPQNRLSDSLPNTRVIDRCPECGKSFDDCDYFRRLEEDD